MTLERTYSPGVLARVWPARISASAEVSGQLVGRKLAYLVNEYPKVSHSFIRREILALERRGWQISRFSIRGWNPQLADPADVSELQKTVFILKYGVPDLILAVLGQMVRAPRRFFTALGLAIRAMRWSDRPFVWHLFYLAEACWVSPRLVRQRIAHLHAHFGTNPAEVAMYVSILTGISYSITIHGPEEFDRASGINLGEKIRRASFVVAISSYCRSQLYRLVGRRHWHKIKVVYCGVDTDFSGLETVTPSQSNQFVCVGRLCGEKGHLLLMQAARTLAREGRSFSLVLVGDGEYRAEIERLIAEYDLSEQVKIIGWASAERVKKEILASRALVLPSFAEGLPIVLMEAMVLGRPVLTTYIAGIPELVIDGKAGWLFPAGSEEHLVEALKACLDAPPERLREMGNFARARALSQHGIDSQADALTDLFESVLPA